MLDSIITFIQDSNLGRERPPFFVLFLAASQRCFNFAFDLASLPVTAPETTAFHLFVWWLRFYIMNQNEEGKVVSTLGMFLPFQNMKLRQWQKLHYYMQTLLYQLGEIIFS